MDLLFHTHTPLYHFLYQSPKSQVSNDWNTSTSMYWLTPALLGVTLLGCIYPPWDLYQATLPVASSPDLLVSP